MPLSVYNTELGVDLAGIPSAEAVGQPVITGGRKPNAAYRSREHLTEAEIVRLMEAARDNRYGARDAAATSRVQFPSANCHWNTRKRHGQ